MKTDIAIIGGGIVGLATALSLSQQGLKTVVIDASTIEQQTLAQYDLRNYAINSASSKYLKSLSVWPEVLAQRVSPYRHMTVWDEGSDGVLSFSAQELALSELGFIIEEKVLKNALYQSVLSDDSIQLRTQSKLTSVDVCQDQVFLAFKDQEIQAKLVIGADGANSWLRQHLKFQCQETPYQHHAIVSNVTTEFDHKQTAYQIFTKEGPLAFLPMRELHQCSIVWSVPPEKAETLMALSQDEFLKTLTQTFQNKLGAVTATSKRVSFPLIERVVSPYVKPRVALVGDALHTVHPLAGLGVNLGLSDVAALSKSIADNVTRFDSLRTLRQYERSRKGAVWGTTQLMKMIKATFSDSGIPGPIRALGMNSISQLPFLKKRIIESAAGI